MHSKYVQIAQTFADSVGEDHSRLNRVVDGLADLLVSNVKGVAGE